MRYFYLDSTTPLNFLVCGMLSSKNGFLHMKRQFSDNVFILIKKGTLKITANGKPFILSENQFIFLKANESHFGTEPTQGEIEYYWAHFSDNLLISKDFDSAKNFQYFIPETGNINNSNKVNLLFNQLLDFYMSDKTNKPVLDFSLSLLILELASELKQKINEKDFPPLLYNAMNWIKTNYIKDFSIQELSDFLNCSPSHISTLFKKNLDLSIIQYTNRIRIDSAKSLLSYFGYSVKECAYECGFVDEKYFMKVFKTLEGITPTEYKNTFFKKNIN